jgi:hypothetical protein
LQNRPFAHSGRFFGHKGRIAIVTVRWVRDAVDALALQTSGAKADGEVVWS